MTMQGSIAAARIKGPQHEADGSAVFEFRFGAGDPMFAGHFPGRPLLPGVCQLEMARLATAWALNCPLSVRAVCRAKFRRPILPEENVRLELRWRSEDGGVVEARAALSVNGEPASESVLQLWRSA